MEQRCSITEQTIFLVDGNYFMLEQACSIINGNGQLIKMTFSDKLMDDDLTQHL